MAEQDIEPTATEIGSAFKQYQRGKNKGVVISTEDNPSHDSRHLVVGDVVEIGGEVYAETFAGVKKVKGAQVYK